MRKILNLITNNGLATSLVLTIIQRNIWLVALGDAGLTAFALLSLINIRPKQIDYKVVIPLNILLILGLIQLWLGLTQPSYLLFLGIGCILVITSTNQTISISKILTIFAPVVSISVILLTVINHVPNGGLLDPVNYNLVTISLGLSLFMISKKWQIRLTPLILLGILYSGAGEGWIYIITILTLMLIRKEFWLVISSILTLGIGYWLLSLNTHILDTNLNRLNAINSGNLQVASGYRWEKYLQAFQDIKIIGHGYWFQWSDHYPIHNVPLEILFEMGPVGLLAWIWLFCYKALTTKRWYLYTALFVFSMVDHALWTAQMMAWFMIAISLPSEQSIIREKIVEQKTNSYVSLST